MNEKVGKLQEEKMQIALLGNEKLSASARLACTLVSFIFDMNTRGLLIDLCI